MNQVVRVQESTYSGIDKQGHEGNKDSGVPTSAEIRENTKHLFSKTVEETLRKWAGRYGPPEFVNSIAEEIAAHAMH